MLELKVERVRVYLSEVYKGSVEVSRVAPIGGTEGSAQLKGFGYGVPYLVEFTVNGDARRVVLETMKPGDLGMTISLTAQRFS